MQATLASAAGSLPAFIDLDLPWWAWVVFGLAAVALVFVFRFQVLVKFPLWILSHTLYRLRVVGRENIPRTGPALLVCNHVSHVDALLVLAAQSRHIRFRFFERTELRAAADEGVPPEPSALDRLEQERAARVRAQPEVCPERGDQVSGYVAGRVHGRTKRPPAGGQVERNGLCAGVSPGAGSRPARSARTTRCEWRESSVPSG